jgi:GT2 family glycosyltransferase
LELSVIIITWNAKHFLEKCLESIYCKNKNFEFELIIIDNNSKDGSIEFINENYKCATLIKNKKNRGVAPARNQGLKIAKGKYVLILDVDTEILTDNAFKILIDYMNQNTDVGILGTKLIFPSGEFQYTCRKFPSVWVKLFNRFEFLHFLQRSKMMDEHYMVSEDHNQILDVDYIIGAFQFIRKSVIDKIGLYDEKIFYGPEDIDYCLRIKKNGYKVVYFPDVVLYHFYQRITKRFFSKITFAHIKALVYFYFKHKYIIYPKL